MGEVNGVSRSPRARWVIAGLAAALAAVWLAMMLLGTGPLDRRLYEALYAGDHPTVVAIARLVSHGGDPNFLVPATFVAAAILWWRGHPRTGLTLVAVAMAGRGVNSLVKLDVARPRPTLEPHLVVEHSNSFPSGHSAGSMVFFLALALLVAHRGPWRRTVAAVAVLAAMAVGITRVMLGVHWPSDVIGGWAFGALWVIVTLEMAEDLVAKDAAPRR